jgi:hypothetical protein
MMRSFRPSLILATAIALAASVSAFAASPGTGADVVNVTITAHAATLTKSHAVATFSAAKAQDVLKHEAAIAFGERPSTTANYAYGREPDYRLAAAYGALRVAETPHATSLRSWC